MPRRRATLAACGAALSLGAGCGIAADSVPEISACRNLTYDKKGPTRTAYLPCAGEIIKSEPHPFAAETKEAARAEMLGGRRNYQSARTNYRRAGGG